MAQNEDRMRFRQLGQRIAIKREDASRLRDEIAVLAAERKTLKEKLTADAESVEN